MQYKNILISGGAGFVGSAIALGLSAHYSGPAITVLDNLHRRGSELNVPRLTEAGIRFVRGDVRNAADWALCGACDLIVECSAEPSVLAGYGSSPEYMLHTNLSGTLHALEHARRFDAGMLFLSTSRVYPIAPLRALKLSVGGTRYEMRDAQEISGASPAGINEDFPLQGVRSLYGATKLASELVALEFEAAYGLPVLINRCGVIAGPWQMGKVDQGVAALWAARHLFGGALGYIGFGGRGLQVRDFLHIDDFVRLTITEVEHLRGLSGKMFNVGGGPRGSASLRELTALCEAATGNNIHIASVSETRPADVPWYITDNTRVTGATGWTPELGPERIVEDIVKWMRDNREPLQAIFG